MGLKQALNGLKDFPDTAYLLIHGDMILMHLQHLDELIEAALHVQLTQERLFNHDLLVHRQLRGYKENHEEEQAIIALNCRIGDHYPHRYKFSSLHKKEKTPFPLAVRWRLDASILALHSQDFDRGFTPVYSKDKEPQTFTHPKELLGFLIDITQRMLPMMSKRLLEKE